MGTTLTLLWPGEKEMLIAQVGDSRAYLIRDGKMRQVTEDHSLVGDMVRRGVLTEEQAACHPMRNYITRAVGTEDTIEVDLYSEERKKGDRWLICSDGLYSQMTKTTLEEAAQTEDPETAADRLLQAALEGGGKDNITLILMTDETEIETETASDETKTGEAEA
jgi:protein phosphatase